MKLVECIIFNKLDSVFGRSGFHNEDVHDYKIGFEVRPRKVIKFFYAGVDDPVFGIWNEVDIQLRWVYTSGTYVMYTNVS